MDSTTGTTSSESAEEEEILSQLTVIVIVLAVVAVTILIIFIIFCMWWRAQSNKRASKDKTSSSELDPDMVDPKYRDPELNNPTQTTQGSGIYHRIRESQIGNGLQSQQSPSPPPRPLEEGSVYDEIKVDGRERPSLYNQVSQDPSYCEIPGASMDQSEKRDEGAGYEKTNHEGAIAKPNEYTNLNLTPDGEYVNFEEKKRESEKVKGDSSECVVMVDNEAYVSHKEEDEMEDDEVIMVDNEAYESQTLGRTQKGKDINMPIYAVVKKVKKDGGEKKNEIVMVDNEVYEKENFTEVNKSLRDELPAEVKKKGTEIIHDDEGVILAENSLYGKR